MDIKQIKEKVLGFIKNIPADKKKHLIAGFIVCAIVSMFFGLRYWLYFGVGSRCW